MNRAERRRQRKEATKEVKNAKFVLSGSQSSDQQALAILQALNLAIQLHNEGNLSKAEGIYQDILTAEPNQPTALHLLGVIAHQNNKSDIALELIKKSLSIKPDYVEAHNNLGNVFRGLGKLDEAANSLRKAITIKPDYAEAHNSLGSVLMDLGELEDAVVSFNQALAIRPDYADAYNNLGSTLTGLGKLDDASASFLQALGIRPYYVEALSNLGNVLRERGKLDEAIESLYKALAINPEFAPAHSNLGNVLQDQGNLDEAAASYHKALTIWPDYAEAHYNYCEILETTNNTEALSLAVNNARANCPGNPLIAFREAQLFKRNGDFEGARAVLEVADGQIIDAKFLSGRAYLLGNLCDRLGDYEAAFNYFKEGNRQCANTYEAEQADAEHYQTQVDFFKKRYTADWIADWQELEVLDDLRDPVFMIGFPRSGTTLLDTILRSHPNVSVVEEIPAITDVQNILKGYPGGYPEGLASLGPDQLAELRQTYFKELDNHLLPNERTAVVVDKMPLNLIHAGLIHRILPKARFLFVQRHPCDCVLSCFMQNFALNDSMANFLEIENAARLYDKAMNLWQQYQRVLSFKVHTIRYENLITAFEETMIPLLEFLELDWDGNIRNYAETARKRGKISTPSYDQVTQPLYTRARGRWERYRKQMQPVLPLLLPWADRFGYDN